MDFIRNTPSLYNAIPCLQSNVRVCSQNPSKFTSQWTGTVPAVRLVNEIPPGFNIFRLCRGDGILLILLFLLLPAWSETRKGQNQLESSWFTCENQQDYVSQFRTGTFTKLAPTLHLDMIYWYHMVVCVLDLHFTLERSWLGRNN